MNNVTNQPIYLRSGDPETENEATLYYPGMLGSRFTVRQAGPAGPPGTTDSSNLKRFKTYQYIQTDSTMTLAPYDGAVAWWANQAKYLVTTNPATLGRGRVAGVFRNAITPGNYGCIQTKGPCQVQYLDAPTAEPSTAGLIVIPSATAGKADCLGAGTAATYPPLGRTVTTRNVLTSMGIVDLDVAEVP